MRGGLLRGIDDRALPALLRIVEHIVRHRVLLGGLAIGLAAALVGAAIVGNDDGPPPPAAAVSVQRVGPVEGTSIPGYVASAQVEVAGLPTTGEEPVYALVALTGYGTPAQVAQLSAGYEVGIAYFRIPLVGMQNEIRPSADSDLRRAIETQMLTAAAQAERAAKAAEAQAALLTGSSTAEQQLKAFYAESARLSLVHAKEYRAPCACVYAFVVKATPLALMALTKRAGVRVVDPAPEVAAFDQAVFLPLLPEQRSTVEPPAVATLPPLPASSASPK